MLGRGYDKVLNIDAATLAPFVTWGTNPGMVVQVTERVPELNGGSEADQRATEQALQYMGLKPGTPIEEIAVDRVFIGSCTNSRIGRFARGGAGGEGVSSESEGARDGGAGIAGREASGGERRSASDFPDAGFEWRESGCSMCLGMNPDILQPGERCASTSNRNFEGRQGRGGRTHLVSPMMAAAAAIAGHFTDIRKWKFQ